MIGSTLDRYVARQIYGVVGFVLLGFLALFAFFDLVGELSDLGEGNYQLRQVLGFVLLSMPTHAYELLPIAVLIGSLYALSQMAANSEFTVMRASGMSHLQAGAMLLRVGLVFAVLTLAEIPSRPAAVALRISLQISSISAFSMKISHFPPFSSSKSSGEKSG